MTRAAWRDQVIEQAIDASEPIVDAHHHVWEKEPFPPFDPYDGDALIADKSAAHNVVATVYVDSHTSYRSDGPEALRVVGETDYAERIATAAVKAGGRAAGICAAIAPRADLMLGQAVEEVLDAHAAASSRFRGVRHMTAYDIDVPASHATGAGVMMHPQFREGIVEVFRRGLSFDAWLLQPQLPEVIDLARRFPEGLIVLDHLGGPLAIGRFSADPIASFAAWKLSMAELSACPNVRVKLGGLNMGMAGVDALARETPFTSEEMAASQRSYILTAIDLFGPDRCMFESNVPVDTHGASYTVIWNAFQRLASGFSASDRAKLFKETAMTTYQIEPALISG
ncbi:amidohydrolase family protein [soil metagenome]